MKVYFFGCKDVAGHSLEGGKWEDIPWGYELDSGLCPPGAGRVYQTREQKQGHAALHRKDGWTLISWWDRSGPDKRMGCNSGLLAEGEHNFDQMKGLLKAHWPEIHKRQPVDLFLFPDPSNPTI